MLTDSSRDTREPLDRGWGMMKGPLVAVSKLFIYILIGRVDSRYLSAVLIHVLMIIWSDNVTC